MKKIIKQLKEKVIEAVQENSGEGLLFSGGLDSSIVAAACLPKPKAFTIGFKSYGEDPGYAKTVAEYLGFEHHLKIVDIEEATSCIPEVVKILRSFDPVIPNDVTVYLGLKYAKEMGVTETMTGDGGDELFAGYSFMQKVNVLDDYIRKMVRSMRFSSNEIGRHFQVKIKQPFLNKELIDFSLTIRPELKIKNQNNITWGKWILRKAFEDDFPKEIIWQDKRPLEYGSGMTKLREFISAMVSDQEFGAGKKNYPIKFWNKEHFYYYRIYREVVGEIPKPENNEKACFCCGAGIKKDTFHCRVCGSIANEGVL
ncbi:MAG: asparagine synthase C-terminal domain-containing protein [Deltaproteobacteria bacterium]|nr:asparagine synthase C-terminal domain-containing protein [Deltaproteobacteria bacterium]